MTEKARNAFVEVVYEGVNITDEVTKDLVGFDYTDYASGSSDTIDIILRDEERKWIKDWFPVKGDIIKSTIHMENWTWPGTKRELFCGRFFVDNPEYSGGPGQLSIRAIASPLNKKFKDVDRTKTWRNITLQQIASDIAARAGLQLETYLNGNNPRYDSKEQSEISDSAFLSDLCDEEGLSMKATDSKIIIFDEAVFEQREPVVTIQESGYGTKIISYDFWTSLANTAYEGVKAIYYNPDFGQNIEFLYAPNGVDEDSKIYQLNTKFSSGDEARRRAQKKYRQLNKHEYEGSLNLIGDRRLLGGSCLDLQGFGIFDGKYYIKSAAHSIGNGYTVDVEIRKVLEG